MNTATEFTTDNVLLIEESCKGRLIKASEILYLEDDDNYCKLFLINKEAIVVCRTLLSYEEELSSDIFFRCHKSYLVNIFYIKEYQIKKHEFIIILLDQTALPVARRRVSKLKHFLHVHISIKLPLTK